MSAANDTLSGVLRHVFTWPDRVLLRDWSSAVESSPHVEVLADLVQRYVALRRHAPGWSPRRYDRNNHRHIPNDDIVALLLDARRIDKDSEPPKKPKRTGRPRVRCVVCRTRFVAERSTARYCSDTCKQRAKRGRRNDARPTSEHAQGTGGPNHHDPAKPENRSSDGSRPNGAA